MKKTIFALATAAAIVGTAAFADTTVKLTYGQDFTAAGFGVTTENTTGVAVAHDFGAYSVGASYSGNADAQNLEATVGRRFVLTEKVSVGATLGLGERFAATDFPYYTVGGDVGVKLNDKFTWTAIDYRYRNAFDTANNYESHRVGTSVSYAVTNAVAVNAGVYRSFDNNFDATGNTVELGLAYKF